MRGPFLGGLISVARKEPPGILAANSYILPDRASPVDYPPFLETSRAGQPSQHSFQPIRQRVDD